MLSSEVRETFLDFFEKRGHRRVESASLVPHDDPTLLFVNAGMVPFKETFVGNVSRDYARAVSCQRCVRAGGKHNDLEEVGYTGRHQTMFEMLGNFSFGDYFKKDAIAWAWELATQEFNLDKNRLYISVFKEDDEAEKIWRSLGVAQDRIYRFGEKDNFWSMGDTGPCGPCSELFYDLGPEAGEGPEDVMGGEGDRYLEFYNLVFMQYEAKADGSKIALPKPSIDTGMGLERITAILQGKLSNYGTDLFQPLIAKIADSVKQTDLNSDQQSIAHQVLSDHVRTASLLMADGILPSNLGRGYVLRRILRRAIRYSYQLGFRAPFLCELVPVVTELLQDAHPVLFRKASTIAQNIGMEEESFLRTVKKGLELLDGEVSELQAKGENQLSGDVVFKLYDTFGFPRDLTEVILRDRKFEYSSERFDELMENQRERARSAQKFGVQEDWEYETFGTGQGDSFVGYDSTEAQAQVLRAAVSPCKNQVKLVLGQTPFYAESGGQVGDQGVIENDFMKLAVIDTQKEEGEIVHYCNLKEGNFRFDEKVEASVDSQTRYFTRKNHTAVHLLQGVLRERFGESIQQAGSFVDSERFRFDFTMNRGLSKTEICEIEADLFDRINRGKSVMIHDKTLEEAREMGAICPFGEKYGDRVRVVDITGLSLEFCGGTHVEDISEIGMVKIISEASISAGVRRIEGVVSRRAFDLFQEEDRELRVIQSALNRKDQISASVLDLQDSLKQSRKENQKLRREISEQALESKLKSPSKIQGLAFLQHCFDSLDNKSFRVLSDQAIQRLGSGVVLLFNQEGEKVNLICKVSDDWVKKGLDASNLMQGLAPLIGGRGGGRKNMSQAGGGDSAKIASAMQDSPAVVEEVLGCLSSQ